MQARFEVGSRTPLLLGKKNDFDDSGIVFTDEPGDPADDLGHISIGAIDSHAVASGLPVMGICLRPINSWTWPLAWLFKYVMAIEANQPVADLKTRRVWITSQNHGFAVADPEHMPLFIQVGYLT